MKGLIPVNFKSKKKLSKQILKNKHETEEKLRNYAFLTTQELLESLSVTPAGLTTEESENRQEEYGRNIITVGKKDTVLHRLWEASFNPFNLILILIAVITYFTDVVFSTQPDYLTVSIILTLVCLSSLIAFIQGQRSNKTVEKLSEMISNKADVWRDEQLIQIPMDEIVPGDIIRLSAGDMLPADVRFLSTKDAFVAQSALTGESNPVEKFSDMRNKSNDALTDLRNIGFMGSNMISGSARAVALATGNDTYFGSMAKSLSGDRAKTSFERGVDSVSRLLVRLMLVMVPVVFLINGLAKGDWSSALLFAVSIAVGLTPEMLPVIMTSTLAKGAVSMAKHKVIVRTLGAIQVFGEMDVLCTDKTGTLTEDKIILEKYMNLRGEDDTRILRHAFLNSYFQTGLKNLIDHAVINRAAQYGYGNLLGFYTRVDEIPFDFSRRRMSVVLVDNNGKRQLITKGAVEEMIEISSFMELDGRVLPMDEESKRVALEIYEKYNSDGLRILAVAQKNEVPDVGAFSVADEKDMVLIGFVGFLDPPKESAKAAIEALRDHGVRTVVLTGDSEGVAIKVCGKVSVDTSRVLTGRDVETMDDAALREAVKTCDLFAKLAPAQKKRVVKAFQAVGHTVGYMGDGINDAPALRQADVGITVDSAVDIAKETADIILLKKDLMVLEEGVIEGRRTFGNIVKYIKMAASGNFGNIVSVIVASILLPFLPMLPVQILTQNLLCDFSQMGMPFDSVDEEYVKKPRKWDTQSIMNFISFFGPLSSIFDILCFAVLWWIIGANTKALAPIFQSGWFVYGTVSQVLVIHTIRTAKIPFIQSRPTIPLIVSTFTVTTLALAVGFSHLAVGIDMRALPLLFAPWLALILTGYFLFAQLNKRFYIKRYGEWL
ncbi:MAG TPA: magnesium-translocating P-type ATPase [Thermotogota bacterium]|jgi:Mg2+-importing ATPase|nr:magnesium-translocating P-type ATPase [Thermotogota bacterium]OQC31064.1 MAG: Magnesium-transporting ATPase, P-type 1 [Thermotogota bacterium ADurb.Bin062]HNW47460.1 magnesium-translocating P-type ATPase [Thermotogota bacterium]HOD91498.1 magnesium-translocating P-type ATPase [Thermotogota bacterium]HOF23858.1 magnesium-translocating P-type ATPase [Thermotogota bacterium]